MTIMTMTKTPISVLVLSTIEVALGVVGAGVLLDNGPFSSSDPPAYVIAYDDASALVLAVALFRLALGVRSSMTTGPRRLGRANAWTAIAAFLFASGYFLSSEIATWASASCTRDGCSRMNVPTLHEVLASVVLDIGAGAMAALLPIIAIVLVRNTVDTTAEPQPTDRTPHQR